jgi:hypothetical protein
MWWWVLMSYRSDGGSDWLLVFTFLQWFGVVSLLQQWFCWWCISGVWWWFLLWRFGGRPLPRWWFLIWRFGGVFLVFGGCFYIAVVSAV